MEGRRAREKGGAATKGLGDGPTETLLRGLLAEAYRSPEGEAYDELAHGAGYRLAIAVTRHNVRLPQYAFVVLIDSPDRVGPRGRIRRGGFARVESALAARGYVSTRLDYGWMAYERSRTRSQLAAEWRFLHALLETAGLAKEAGA